MNLSPSIEKSPWSKNGAVVRALTSHQCGPGSIPGPGVICGFFAYLFLFFYIFITLHTKPPQAIERLIRFFMNSSQQLT